MRCRNRLLSGLLLLAPALALGQPVSPVPTNEAPAAGQSAATAAPPGTASPPPQPAGPEVSAAAMQKPAPAFISSKWTTSFYGFVEADYIYDTTQSFNDLAGNANIARPSTYAGQHDRMTFSLRNSRLGFRFSAPEFAGIKASGNIEADFLGNQPSPVSEAGFFQNPTFRIRHAFVKLEDEYVDVLAGQYWQLFGWQSLFHPNTVDIQGVPGQVYSRAPQLRLSHTFRTQPINLEVAVAAARPPQRNAALPDGQGGVKLVVNDWKGFHTVGATGSGLDGLSVGVSGLVRKFALPNFAASPTSQVSTTGWGVSVDGLIPVIPASKESHANALTLTGSFARGAGTADQYTGLTGGVSFPSLPNPTKANPAPTYTPDVDNGLVTFDSKGQLTAVQWQSWIAGVQYYLPIPSLWVSANYSHMTSFNIGQLGTAAKVYTSSEWADGNLFWDITSAVRLGGEFAWFHQTYADGVNAVDRRVQLSAFYLF